MKIARFDAGSGPQLGLESGDRLFPISGVASMIDLIAGWEGHRERAKAALSQSEPIPLTAARLLAPVPRPGKIFAIGLNYADHIVESGAETPKNQIWFTKAATAINDPTGAIQAPSWAPFIDYEVELVAVIGKPGRRIAKAQAHEHVFGYCVGDDVTERDWQMRTPQWALGKSFDTHAPIGPWITTADEIADPHALDLRCLVNGEMRQNSNTRHLVFNLWDQIEHLSLAMTLEPGDLIFTGTPGGVGVSMQPRRYLKDGDVVRCEIDGLGAIQNRVEAI
jgi:2-keto-4-pentenoate hydratase/2-oxohepta-3-ene-1,7-dioic acid hydratase in catechol pathway